MPSLRQWSHPESRVTSWSSASSNWRTDLISRLAEWNEPRMLPLVSAWSLHRYWVHNVWGFLVAQMVKSLPEMQETQVRSLDREGLIPGEGNGHPLQYSCPKNSVNRGAWWVTVHGVTKSETQLSDFHFTICLYVSPWAKSAGHGSHYRAWSLILRNLLE